MLPSQITSHPKYQALVQRRTKFAAQARAAQKAFRRYTFSFVVLTAIAAISSGLVLYGVEAPEETNQLLLKFVSDDGNRRVITWIMAISLAGIAFCEFMNRAEGYGQRHVKNRVQAEMLRWERERITLSVGHENGAETFEAAGTRFATFIDEQIDHAKGSSLRFATSAWILAIVGAGLAAIGALTGALGSLDDKIVAYVALAGVCIPALTAAVKSWGEVDGAKRRSELSASTQDLLIQKKGEIQRFTTAIEAHDLAGAASFQEEVFDILKDDLDGFVEIRTP